MNAIAKIAKRYGPVIIMTLFTIVGGLGDIQAEDEIEAMKAEIAELRSKIGK